MPLSYISMLYQIALERSKSEQGKEQREAEALEDELEDLT